MVAIIRRYSANFCLHFVSSGFGNQGGFAPQPTQDPATLTCGMPPLGGCPNTRYRSYDGSCNNLRNPIWGTPQTPYTRLLPPIYGDGKSYSYYLIVLWFH